MPLDFATPYSSNRSPVLAKNMVATSQPLATWAGLKALADGGNAVDAAIAAATTLTVVEPCSNGIGSDAFALVWNGEQLTGLNASGRSPAGWNPAYFEHHQTMPTEGWDSVTVPGAVSAWTVLSDRFGKLPFERLFDTAIDYADQGFPVGPKSAHFFAGAKRSFARYPEFGKTFLPGGQVPAPGDRLQLPDHARTLQQIAASNGKDFYRGALAESMAADAERHGAILSTEDLASHEPEWVDTLSTTLGNARLHEIPPNGQGLMALIALGIAERLELDRFAVDSADSVHYQIEATRIAWAEVERHLADLTHMRISPGALLANDYLMRRAGEIERTRANPAPTALGASPDTVYLTTADASGQMVSMIQSNYMGFGSGIVVPGTGISLQNRGAGFTLEPGHPNQVGPGKRPFHTIIPGFTTVNDRPSMSFGVMGGHMQAQGHLQMMIRIYLYHQNPQTASDAPRWHLTETGTISLEAGFSDDVATELARRGHRVRRNDPEHLYGGAQLIYRLDDGIYCAGSDHRKEGLALGF